MAAVQYAQISDLANYLPPRVIAGVITQAAQTYALASASSFVNGYLVDQFVLPLIPPYPQDLIRCVCVVATWDLLSLRGFDPTEGPNVTFEARYRHQVQWLEAVQAGRVTPNGIQDSAGGTVRKGGARVSTSSVRGFNSLCPSPAPS